MTDFGRSAACLAVLMLAAVPAPTPAGDKKIVSAGTWGGQGISVDVKETGARIEYDCAHGTVDEPMVLDAEGGFDARGLHYRESPGPVREGRQPRGEPVRYSGRVEGDTMTLTVKPESRDESYGTFTLVRGRPGRIRKCA